MADVFNSVLRLGGPNKSSINNSEMSAATNQTFENGDDGPNGQWTTTQESFMSEEEIAAFLQKMFSGRNFDRRTESAILFVFVLLIAFGVLGNSLVCYVVARNPRMRTPRNVFIINLAVSDLTLCLVTQPFSLVKVLTTDWRLGRTVCKLASMFAGMNVFVSTASITAIALDRYRVIVYPTRQTTITKRSRFFVVPLASVWLASVVLACPLLVLNDTGVFAPVGDVPLYETCVEDPRMQLEKKVYSVASMLVQYIVPIVVVSAAHAQISRHLKYRMTVRKSSSSAAGGGGSNAMSLFQQQKSLREARRKRRTDFLLTMISVVYAASWLPLNVFNIMADFHWNDVAVLHTFGGGLLVPICHVLVLCSACTNPLLYGWLNENFRHEFFKALRCLNPLLKVGAGGKGEGGGGGHGVNSQNSTTFDLASRRLSTNAAVRQLPAVIS